LSIELRNYRQNQASAKRYQGLATQFAANRGASEDARFFNRTNQLRSTPDRLSSWERSLRPGLNSSVKPPATLPDYLPGAKDKIVTTDPSEIPKPDPYPTVLPSLSAAQLGQLSERRRLVDEKLKQAEAESERRNTLAAASAERSRQDASRNSRRSVESFMRQAGGRGVARSPMVAGRAVRQAGEDLRLAYGEIDTKLSTDMMALQDLVSRAEDERNIAFAGIEQERVNMQADLDRLFPAASMYR
jgi:hypothetical protein